MFLFYYFFLDTSASLALLLPHSAAQRLLRCRLTPTPLIAAVCLLNGLRWPKHISVPDWGILWMRLMIIKDSFLQISHSLSWFICSSQELNFVLVIPDWRVRKLFHSINFYSNHRPLHRSDFFKSTAHSRMVRKAVELKNKNECCFFSHKDTDSVNLISWLSAVSITAVKCWHIASVASPLQLAIASCSRNKLVSKWVEGEKESWFLIFKNDSGVLNNLFSSHT